MQLKNRITGTVPVIIHSPGLTFSRRYNKTVHAKRNPLWAYLLKHWEQASPPGQPGPDISRDLVIISWNTGFGKSLLERSLDRLGVPCTVLGRGHQNWSNPLKMALAREFLETVTTPYVLALDAYDVLVLDHPAKALQRFQQMNCDILFNAAMQFYPDFGKQNPEKYITDTWKRFQKQVGRPPWTFINAGACIARRPAYLKFAADCQTRDVKTLIRAGRLPEHHSKKGLRTMDMEQVRVNWCFSDWFPRVQLDDRLRIFMPTENLSRKDIRLTVPVYKVPEEWLVIVLDTFRVWGRSFFRAFADKIRPVLDQTRTVRGRLGLRKTQLKNRFK